ncbi:MAG: AAA family ATPase [Pseudomonadota bacterium]
MPVQNDLHFKPLISQDELLSFLLNPRSYPHRPNTTHLVQTHAAYVIILPPYVYKVKKPVNFGFLDFTTLEKRHYFLKREIELNQRLCPEIYVDVVPISLSKKKLIFGEGEEVVEFALKMHKLTDQHFLKQLIKQGNIRTEDLDRVILKLKSFYESQTPKEEISRWGRIEKLKISTNENFRQIEDYIGLTLSLPIFKALRFYTDSFYIYNASLFDSRIREGRIKDCHGDLHLEHIHLSPRSVCIYDCVEFNDRLRYIDVANDIAFLAMDLDNNGRHDLSRYFVTQMANALRDSTMSQIMDFYKCYRSTVVGKVESLRSSEPEVSEQERKISHEKARRYFCSALQYAVIGSQPTVLVVMGHIGSGKSTLAKRLAQELGLEVFSSDRVRKELAGIPLYERGKESTRYQLYSKAMKEKTYEMLFDKAEKVVKGGGSLILDATFNSYYYRNQLRKRLDRLGVSYCFIETKASNVIIKKRLLKREEKAYEVSDARFEDFETLKQSYEPPLEIDSLKYFAVDTEKEFDETLTDTLKRLVGIHLGESS